MVKPIFNDLTKLLNLYRLEPSNNNTTTTGKAVVGVPGQVVRDGYSKVLSCFGDDQIMAVDLVHCLDRVSFLFYSDDLTFSWIK